MVKRRAILLIVLVSCICICIGGCGIFPQGSPSPVAVATPSIESIDIDEIREAGVGIFDGIMIPNERVAKKISDLYVTDVVGLNPVDMVVSKTLYDPNRGVWWVWYAKDIPGLSLNIALSEKTGEVLLLWSDE